MSEIDEIETKKIFNLFEELRLNKDNKNKVLNEQIEMINKDFHYLEEFVGDVLYVKYNYISNGYFDGKKQYGVLRVLSKNKNKLYNIKGFGRKFMNEVCHIGYCREEKRFIYNIRIKDENEIKFKNDYEEMKKEDKTFYVDFDVISN